MDRQKTILSQYGNKKIREKKFGSSIEPPSAKSYLSVSGRFSHSGSHTVKRYMHKNSYSVVNRRGQEKSMISKEIS